MTKQIEVLAEREESSMASTCTKYLCLQFGDSKAYCLFTGMYEGLEQASEYFNEDTEDYDLPEEIDGKKVVGIDDETVIGGDPSWSTSDEVIEFDTIADLALNKWLKEQGWSRKGRRQSILYGIEKLTAEKSGENPV